MKSLLTIRGNLLLVNLVVIGLILWLAVSFLYIAIAQRQEAVLLQQSTIVEKVLSQASASLADEQRIFLELLNSESLTSPQQQDSLGKIVLASDAILSVIPAQIMELSENPRFLEKAPATLDSLERQLSNLKSHNTYLHAQRESVNAGMKSPNENRENALLTGWREAHRNIQTSIANLSKSIKYLPEHDSATVRIYHTLLNEILATRIKLTQKNSALGSAVKNSSTSNTSTEFRIALSSELIEQRISDIVRLAETSGKTHKLRAIAINIHSFYLQEYLLKGQTYELSPESVSPDIVKKSYEQWLLVSTELSRLLDELERSTQGALEQLAQDSYTLAERNLIIDIFLVVLCFAITVLSVTMNRKVKRYAYHDTLTGLSNRLSFETSLSSAATSSTQKNAVIFLDLDRFKSINDTYGHSTGDQLLIEIARRLKSLCKPSDVSARLGGDEFAVLLHNVESSDSVLALATSMVEAIEQVVRIQELNLKVGASAGFSLAPEDCQGGVQLLRNADIAMYHAKTNNLSQVFRFVPKIAVNYKHRMSLELDLKRCLDNQEFHLVYQPKVCTHTGRVKSVEALLRWNHPERGLVSPVEFIPIAEDMGLMGAIGFWVIDEACRELASLRDTPQSDLQVAVNISAQQFNDESFVTRLCSSLDTQNLDYSRLSLEVTESIVMTDVKRVIAILRSLQKKGIDIAIDDFGTGYSSLQYLQELPLNTLKIDRAFIAALDNGDPDCSVANSIVQMASLFKLETVAEGVETPEQEARVRTLGVDHIQGYLYSKPVSSDNLLATIHTIEQQSLATGLVDNNKAA